MGKFLAVNLEIGQTTYKLASAVIGSDQSFYISFSSRAWVDKKVPGATPMKLDYHSSGKGPTVTVGSGSKRIATYREQPKTPIHQVSTSEPIGYFSLFEINHGFFHLLDTDRPNRGYEHALVIKSSQYKHLTVRFYIANKAFELTSPSHNYQEVQRYDAGVVDLLVATENIWLGDEKEFSAKGKP